MTYPLPKRLKGELHYLPSYFLLNALGVDILEDDYFHEGRYIREAKQLLHTTMLFKWLLQEFGPIDSAKITYDDVQSVWLDLLEIGDIGRRGVIARRYILNELDFWREMYPQKPAIDGTKENPIVVD